MKKNLTNKMVFGVCSGIADELNVDPLWIRGALIILTLMGFGLPIIIYIIMALIMQS